MNRFGSYVAAFVAFAVCAFIPASVFAQNSAAPVRIVVTAEARKGSEVAQIAQADVMVNEGRDRDQVTSWVPAQGENAALELVILLDDGSGMSLGTQLDELKKFILAQPASTKVALAYMQDGMAKMQQNLTSDHAAVANAVRLPMGIPGVNASPYFSLSDLVKRWPQSSARREVLMITDGIDRYYGSGDPQDPYLSAAIDDAQRAGVLVYGIYTPGAGHFGHSYWQAYWGQIYLSHLAEDAGGEAYYIGMNGPPVTFNPYLEDFERHLNNQYWLTFNPKPEKKSGWHSIKVSTETPNAELVAPHKVYVNEAK